MFWFKEKKKNYLGIDIGESAIKLVELEKSDSRYNLKNYGIYSFESLDMKIHKLDNEEVAEIIKSVIEKAGIKTKQAFFSIPVYFSFSTLINVPKMSKNEIASAVSFEAKKYVPVPMSEVILDWVVVNPISDNQGSQVLLVAVLKEAVNNYSQIAKLCGLRLDSLEVETFSMVRALIGNDKSGVVLIDIGARSTNISIVDGGNVRVIYNLESGGIKLTSIISSYKKVSGSEAEKIKKELSKNQDVDLDKEVNYFLDSIIVRVKEIVDSYQNKYNRKLDKYILVGGSSQIHNIVDYFFKNFDTEVSLGNPFARLVYPTDLDPILYKLIPTLSVATGLAMR
ncbi:type IV pilus assembly protein PilM [Patescibacteria group bacterium]